MVDEPQITTETTSTETASAPQAAPAFDTTALDATQGLIVRLSQQLEDLQKKQKELKDMLKGIFDNDEGLQKAQTEAEAQLKTAKSRKTELGQSSQAIELKNKIADASEDIKLIMESLNTHLLNYYQLTSSTTVDFPGGEEREMVIKAKLKRGASKQE